MMPRYAVLAITPAIFILDRLTKVLIERKLTFWDTIPVIPGFFSIVHAQNRGAAFSILEDAPEMWRSVVLVGVALTVTVFVAGMLWNAFRYPEKHSGLVRAALALVLGGAAGNIFDRVAKGSVTDFLLFYVGEHQWPAFNVADSAISIGAVLLLFDMWRGRNAQGTVAATERH
jgi:signal peptidase II